MNSPRAFLIDVYDTMLICDFEPFATELPRLAGVSETDWDAGYQRVAAALGVGKLTMTQSFAQILRDCGVEPAPGLVADLVRAEGELLRDYGTLYEDVLPFLRLLKSRGIKIAIVSNCNENTRAMLDGIGLLGLADALSFSCEVGSAKPSAGIYQHALRQLGVAPGAAVFVDDQPTFCAAAVELGMTAVQMARAGTSGWPRDDTPAPGVPVVGSFREIEAML